MRYRLIQGELVPIHQIPQLPSKRSGLAAPMIIRDTMDALVNPANGLWYESKSAFARGVKDAGCEILGNDQAGTGKPPTFETPPAEADVKVAMEQLGYGG